MLKKSWRILLAVGLSSLLLVTGCGGKPLFAALFTPTLSPSPTLIATLTETLTPQPTDTPLPSLTFTLPPTPSLTPSDTATLPPTDTVTPGPSPTASITPSPTRTSTSTRIPTNTRPPTWTSTHTLTPTITNTPTPPAPGLYISRPGLLSRVLSPIQAEIYAHAGEDGMVRLDLVGEDGRVITHQEEDFSRYKRRSFAFYPIIPYQIQAMAETARLQVITNDKVGRVSSLMSVDLVLLSIGRAEFFDPLITQEPYIFRSPQEDETVGGGSLTVSGLVRPLNDSAVILELTAENGSLIASQRINVQPPSGEQSHTPFSVTLPYKVNLLTPNVRLSLRQEGSRIPGTVALTSLVINLAP